MAVKTPQDLPVEDTGMRSGDLIEKYNPVSGVNEKIDYKNWNSEGSYLSPNRIAFRELTSGTLSVGWNRIAKSTALGDDGLGAMFRISTNDGLYLIEVSFRDSTIAKTHANTNIKIISKSFFGSGDSVISNIRLGKSDSINGAGAVLEVESLGSSPVGVQKIGNSGRGVVSSFELTAISASDGLCADGVTPATFLEAGAELSWNSNAMFVPNTTFSKATNDIIAVAVNWPEIPKQGTDITLTPSAVSMTFIDGIGTGSTLGSFTITNLLFDGYTVRFDITQVGIATTLNAGLLGLKTNGSGGKLTIT